MSNKIEITVGQKKVFHINTFREDKNIQTNKTFNSKVNPRPSSPLPLSSKKSWIQQEDGMFSTTTSLLKAGSASSSASTCICFQRSRRVRLFSGAGY